MNQTEQVLLLFVGALSLPFIGYWFGSLIDRSIARWRNNANCRTIEYFMEDDDV